MNTKSQINEQAFNALIHPQLKLFTITFFMVLAIVYSRPLYSQSVPEAPINVTASPSAVCPSSPYAYLKAISPGNTIRWYSVSAGGTPIGTTASGGSLYVNVTQPTSYFAESVTPAQVTSISRTVISVGVNTAPVITYMPPDVNTNNASGQCGTIVTYPSASAIGTPTPNIIYSDSSGSNFDGGSTTVIVSAVNVCATSSLSFDVTVNDIEAPTIAAPADISLVAPSGMTSVPSPFLGMATASDNCGIITIYNDAPAVFPAGTTLITWTTIDYNNNVSYSTQLVTVQVDNIAPVLNSVVTNDADNIVAQGSSISIIPTWTDEESGGPYKVEIDWRDGSAHTILSGINAHTVSVPHTYNKTGVFSPVVTVTDGSNASVTSVLKYVVVYVSGNYSTTAEGTFTAPPGCLVSNPNLSSSNRKVEFGNHCKPKSCKPGEFDGELELEMKGAHFEFETENVDWDYLAVSGCYVAEFKGTGFMYPDGHHGSCHGRCHNACNQGYNPGYRYGILVVQSDKYYNPSNTNKIRIKIWNIDQGNTVIFDTQMGAPDDALPTTPISCGTIRVRVPSNCAPRFLNPTYETNAVSNPGFESSVSPNPFVEDFTINFTSENTEKVQLSIFDLIGNKVLDIPNVDPNVPFKVSNHLSPGVYLVHAMQGDHTQVIKVIKN